MKKPKGKLVPVLLVLVNLFVWGIISYQVINYFLSLGDEEMLPGEDELLTGDTPTFEFVTKSNKPIKLKKLSRNPFTLKKNSSAIQNESASPTSENLTTKDYPLASKHYKLTGTINDQDKELAVVENITKKSIHFLKVGESIEKFSIVKILANKAVVKYGERLDTLVIK